MFTANIYYSEDTGSNRNDYQYGNGKANSGIPTLRNEYWFKSKVDKCCGLGKISDTVGRTERFRMCSVLCYLC